MSRKVIAFFSSDAREMYKADIFRSLALPNNYVIHFRYQSQDIHEELLNTLESLKNREGVIFFASGNDTKIEVEKREIIISSMRNVVVKDVFYDRELDLVNFYLQLKEFVDCKPVDGTPTDLLAPNLYVSEMQVDDGTKNEWQDRVAIFQESLPSCLFYFISSIKHGDNELKPMYSKHDRESYYKLYDESDYHIQFSFYNPSNGEFGIKAENVGDVVDFYIPADHEVDADRDTRIFKLYTHTLPLRYRASHTALSIKSLKATAKAVRTINLSVDIQWKVYKSFGNVLLFMLFSVLTAIGVGLASLASVDFSKTTFTCANYWSAGLALLVIAIVSGGFYWLFNKK